jgi:flagellar biogenesis protein FliO
MNFKLNVIGLILLFSTSVFSDVKIKKLDFQKLNKTGKITIHYSGVLKGYPEMKVNGKTIQVTIPNSKVLKNFEKSVSFSSKLIDTQLRAFQTNKKDSKIKAQFPFSIQKVQNNVALSIKDNKIELTFPRVKVNLKSAPTFGSILKKKKVNKKNLDEAYLNKLLTVKSPVNKKKKDVMAEVSQDKITTSLASVQTTAKKEPFSLLEYGGKFVAFLGLVLLLFYGLASLMKKGFLKKGKLGFLNNADQITVINQTYIAPKKSLMLIKAHNQVFLVSNTDQGILPISEIRDVAGLLKDGEKALSGMNFDTNFDLAKDDDLVETKVKLKDDITQSNKQSSMSNYSNVKEKVSFSDQLKKKVQNLKPLQ